MANQLLTPQIISYEFMFHLAEDLRDFGEAICLETGRKQCRRDIVMVRRPTAFHYGSIDSITVTAEGVELDEVSFSCEYPRDALLLSIDDISAQVLRPAAAIMSERVKDLWGPGETLVTAEMDMPSAPTVDWGVTVRNAESGLICRVLSAYNARKDSFEIFFSMLLGFANKHEAHPFLVKRIGMLQRARAQLVAELQQLRAA